MNGVFASSVEVSNDTVCAMGAVDDEAVETERNPTLFEEREPTVSLGRTMSEPVSQVKDGLEEAELAATWNQRDDRMTGCPCAGPHHVGARERTGDQDRSKPL